MFQDIVLPCRLDVACNNQASYHNFDTKDLCLCKLQKRVHVTVSFKKLIVFKGVISREYCTLKQSVLLQHTYFCPQKNTQKGENKRTPFHVLPKHTSVSYPNTPSCVPSTHLNLCFMLVLNLTHFQLCSQERCVLSHILMCQQTYLLMCLKKTHCQVPQNIN